MHEKGESPGDISCPHQGTTGVRKAAGRSRAAQLPGEWLQPRPEPGKDSNHGHEEQNNGSAKLCSKSWLTK